MTIPKTRCIIWVAISIDMFKWLKKRLLQYFECMNINRTYRCTWKEGIMLGLDGIEVYIILLFTFEIQYDIEW